MKKDRKIGVEGGWGWGGGGGRMYIYAVIILMALEPALVAQLDASRTGDKEVADSTPARSATFFHGD